MSDKDRVSDSTLELLTDLSITNDALHCALRELKACRAALPKVRDAIFGVIHFEEYQLAKLHTPKMEQILALIDTLGIETL